jgi:MFS family permease
VSAPGPTALAAAPRRPNVTLAVLATAALAYSVLQSLMAPALPGIQRAFHASASDVSWLFTAFLLATAVGTPILGRLGDMYGKERWLVIALSVIAAGTLLGAVAPSLEVLIGARVVQGLGAGIFPLAFGIVRDELPRERVAGAIGQLSAIIGIGAGAGVVFSGVIIDALSWRWLFWIPCAVALVAIALVRAFVPASPVRSPGQVNWGAATLMTTGLSGFLVVVSQAPSWGWASSRTFALAAAAGAAVVAWIAVELRSVTPLIDMRMMRMRPVWAANLTGFLNGVSTYSVAMLIPQLVTSPRSAGVGFGASLTQSGLYLLPWTCMVLVSGVITGKVAARHGSKSALVAGGALVSASSVLLVVGHDAPWKVCLASGLCGFGLGLTFAALPALIVAAVPPHQTSVASAMNNVTRTVGGAFGTQIAATLLALNVGAGLPDDQGYETAFAFILAGALTGLAAAALAVPGRRVAHVSRPGAP